MLRADVNGNNISRIVRVGTVVEDMQHLLIECVRNRSERETLMTSFNLHAPNVGLFQAVLSSPMSDAARSVCDMLPFASLFNPLYIAFKFRL
jgi:hypothetical protein